VVSAEPPSEAVNGASPSRHKRGRGHRAVSAERPIGNRSKVTNGRHVLPGTSANSLIGRRYRDLVAAIAADMGGADNLSEAKAQMVRAYASISVQREAMEAKLVNGEAIDLEAYCKLISSQVRVSMRLGMKRERPSKDITPPPTRASLADYVAMARAADEDDDTDDMPPADDAIEGHTHA
jgi:hypothetical protein